MALLTAGPCAPPRTGTGRRVLGRAAALTATALVLAALVLPWRPATLCLLRAVTGLPCPFCGSTTVLVELGRGRPFAALAANPFTAVAVPVWVLWPVLQRRVTAWRARVGHDRLLLAGVLLLSLGWQVHRLAG